MDLKSNQILVTGGASGIGLALAARFLREGSQVIVCGRRADKLQEAAKLYPGLITHQADVATAKQREELFTWAKNHYPDLNMLVNNAGIQRRINLHEPLDWSKAGEEIAINLDAPIHLASLFVPFLRQQKNPAIMNVTSGLSFVPLASVPIYCATKAALHSFTLSLRHQLAKTPVKVVEIIPPAVNTDLGGVGLHTFGVDVNEFADEIIAKIKEGKLEVSFGTAEQRRQSSRAELDEYFQKMNPT